jgi:hypothetical protein
VRPGLGNFSKGSDCGSTRAASRRGPRAGKAGHGASYVVMRRESLGGARGFRWSSVLALVQGSLGGFFASLRWTPEERRAARRKQKRGWGSWRRRQSYDGSKGEGSRFPFPVLLPLTMGSHREERRTGPCSVEGVSEGGGYCVRACVP